MNKFVHDHPASHYYREEWTEPLFKCPKCFGGGMCKNTRKILPTFPEQYIYKCHKCGNEEHLLF